MEEIIEYLKNLEAAMALTMSAETHLSVLKEAIPEVRGKLERVNARPPVAVDDEVTVFDRSRFAIPLRGVVVKLSDSTDGVKVRLLQSNAVTYPVGATVWVHAAQLTRLIKGEK